MVCDQKKIKKLGPHLRKNSKNSKVLSQRNMPKAQRSAVAVTCQKLKGQWPQKMAKPQMSAVTEKCQELNNSVMRKCQTQMSSIM